ncbi:MAG: hypothetical protein R2705_10815 [Ilumatobacteraceae bacterium]
MKRVVRWFLAAGFAAALVADTAVVAHAAPPVPTVEPAHLLFVAGLAGPVPGGDIALVDRLEQSGYDVELATVDSLDTAIDESVDLVLISTSVTPNAVPDTVHDLDVPIVTWRGTCSTSSVWRRPVAVAAKRRRAVRSQSLPNIR